MLATLHFPDRSYDAVFLYCVVSDLLGARLWCSCLSGTVVNCCFILGHTNSKTLLSTSVCFVIGWYLDCCTRVKRVARRQGHKSRNRKQEQEQEKGAGQDEYLTHHRI